MDEASFMPVQSLKKHSWAAKPDDGKNPTKNKYTTVSGNTGLCSPVTHSNPPTIQEMFIDLVIRCLSGSWILHKH